MGRAKTEKFPIFAGFSLDSKTNKMSAGYIIGISIKPADFGLTGSEDNATMAAAVVKSLEAQGAAEATARAEAAEQRAEAVVADAQAAAHFAQSVAHLLASPGAEAEAVQHLRADDLPHLLDCLRERLAEQRAEAYRAFAAAVVRGVYPGDTGAVLANHIDTDLLPDALTRLHERLAEQGAAAAEAEVARLRADCAILGSELSEANRLLISGVPQQRGAAAERAKIVAALKRHSSYRMDEDLYHLACEIEAEAQPAEVPNG